MNTKTRGLHTSESKYRTADLYYAAYLKTAGVSLLDAEREGSRVYFIFESSDMIPELKKQYFNRESKVPALTYADDIRSMKALTFSSSS